MEITSINNDKVKNWNKLKEKKYRDLTNTFLVEGDHLVSEALKNGEVLEIITISDEVYDVDTYKVTDAIMKKLSSQVSGTNIIAVVKKIESINYSDNIIILDNIQDPGNMGTIIRSAVAFNFDTVIVSENSVDIYNDKVIRSSEGMIFNINIIKCNIKEFLKNLDPSYLRVSTNVSMGKNIRDLEYKRIALVIGNEGSGVQPDVDQLCDEFVRIKMDDNCESLNAGVSASILMYEVYNG